MFLEILIWNAIGAAAKSHNKRVQAEFRKKFPVVYSKDVPTIKIEPKPFSFYLNQAIEKIK